MSTHSKVDPSTLGWVKTEIDETLKQARLALESFAENPADKTRLRFCVTHLHQVVGTLLMVELDGAALLAKETEALAEAILDEKAAADAGACEILTRGIVTLPDYLARLQYGQPDVPLKHLRLINELRAAHNDAPIAELELFSPDLSVRPSSIGSRSKLTDNEYRELAKRLRGTFQPALLDWLRDHTNKSPLRIIAGVFEQLQMQANIGAVEQVFWVAGGLIEAFIDGGLESTAERKKLIARLDQQVKKLVDGSEKATLRSSSESLVRAILWEVGRATSPGPKVTQLKRVFDLDSLLSVDSANDALSGPLPTPEALQSVSAALGKEIEAAQELMSTYFDPEQGGAVSLEPLLVLLRKMSGTLDMLGVPMLKALVDELLLACRALLDKRLANPETASMPMAEALLCLEHSARDIGRSASEWKKQVEEVTHRLRALHAPDHVVPASEGLEVSDAELSESDYKELLNVVGAEVSVNLGRIEEALEGFAADTSRVQLLDEAPQLLSQVLGAMQILGQSHAAGLIEAAQTHIQNIRKGKLIADSAIMDGLAVCVGTIGAYVEGLRAGRHNLETLIDTALQEMNAAIGSGHGTQPDPAMLIEGLRPSLESWLEDPEHQEALDDLQQRLENLVRMARDQGQEKIEKIGTEMSHLLQLVTEDPMQLSPEAIETLKQSFTAMSVLAGRRMALQTPPSASGEASDETETAASVVTQPVRAAPKVRGAPPPPAPPKTAEEEEFDSEIMQIFVEDAREVLENVNNKFIVWRENTDNQNALTELRRGYHTLKGSGRMVGAGDVAELAWAVEDVLNKVREGKLMPSASIVDLLRQTQDALPSMIDTLAGGPMHTVDVAALRASAIALGHPGAPIASPSDPVKAEPTLASPTATAEPQDDTEPADLPKLDGTLLEIFTTEARGNLTNIRQEIAACRQSGGACLVSDVFFRSTHTLQGNARSLGIEAMSETCAEIEKLLHALKSQRFPLGESHLALAGRFADAVSELVDLLNRGATSSSSALRRRFADLASDIRAENTHVAPAESEEMEPAPDSAAVEIDIETEAGEEIILIDEVPAPVAATPVVSIETVVAPAAPDEAESAVEAIDPELLEIFQEEATDILNAIEEMFTRWRSRPEDRAAVQELKRALHTLKGGARMAGAMTMGNLSHNTETLLRHVEEGAVPIGADLFDLLDEAHDTLVTLLQQAHNPSGRPAAVVQKVNAKLLALVSEESESLEPVTESVPAAPVLPLVETSISMEVEREAEPEPEFEAAAQPESESEPEPERLVAAPAAPITPPPIYTRVEPTPTPMAAELTEETEEVRDGAEPEGKPWLEKMERRGQVRVNTSLLNELVNYAGEVSISRSRMEQQIYSVRDNLSELGRNIVRFRDQIRELEIQSESQILYRMGQEGTESSSRRTDFDPLELDRFSRLQQLSRSLAESLHDLGTIQTNLGNFVGEAETVLQHQARINTELQEGLMRTRMVSFSTQSARLRHIVRSTARELGKRVELQLEGAEVEVDRNVLERMIGPFEHMVRNSLDHGIESEAERRRAGKPAIGRITIASTQQGSEIIIRFSDDGAGLNIAAIRSKATERGLMPADANLTEEELIQFILMSGFSTASQITHVSGRGVGMDVVHNEVKQLGGSMSVDTERGVGTTFIIRLPLTLSIAQALMVYVGDQLYAMPLASVVNIIEFPVEKLNSITTGKNPLLTHNDQTYPYMHLGARLGVASQPRNGRKVPVLLARTGTREVAIQIDGLGGTREVVIKTLGPQLSEIKGLAGATILGDGRVILILDVPGLWYRDDVIHFEHRTPSKAAPEVRERPLIMVVDDSLTVRKVTGKHLQKRGMDVMVAKDGIDAVEQLRDRVPDVMLVDIEMPRMDGYELTTRVRSDADLKHIPIIMITSRAGAKHRQKAFELGVNLYMSKPYQEDELFKNVDALLAKGKAR